MPPVRSVNAAFAICIKEPLFDPIEKEVPLIDLASAGQLDPPSSAASTI
jgi:hypothetical protein